MAKFDSTVFSRLCNSFGNVTVCRTNGIGVLKKKVTMIKTPRVVNYFARINKLPWRSTSSASPKTVSAPVPPST